MFELWIKNEDGDYKRFTSSDSLMMIQDYEYYHKVLGFIAEIRIK